MYFDRLIFLQCVKFSHEKGIYNLLESFLSFLYFKISAFSLLSEDDWESVDSSFTDRLLISLVRHRPIPDSRYSSEPITGKRSEFEIRQFKLVFAIKMVTFIMEKRKVFTGSAEDAQCRQCCWEIAAVDRFRFHKSLTDKFHLFNFWELQQYVSEK